MNKKDILVIGSYRCGCSYGPISWKNRLEYCGIHGDNIQNEYIVPSQLKQKRKRKIRKTNEQKKL